MYFSSLESCLLKYKGNIRLESSNFGNIRKLHYPRVLNIPFLKKSCFMLGFWIHLPWIIRKVLFFETIRNFYRAGLFRKKYKKHWGAGKYKKFSDLRAIKFHFFEIWEKLFWENIRNFFRKKFWGWGRKVRYVATFCKMFHHRCLTVFWIYQDSKYARALNIPFPKYKKNFF